MASLAPTTTGQLSLSIDQVMNNPAAKVTIAASNGVGVSGVLTGDFSVAIGSEYQSLFDIAQIDSVSTIVNRGTTALNSLLQAKGYKPIPQMRLKSPGLTTKQFMGSKDLRFAIDIILINLRQTDNMLETVKDLASLCLPTVIKNDTVGVGVYEAPLGYDSSLLSGVSTGKVSIAIGNWFKATSQIVFDVHFGFSRVGSDANGTPTFSTVRVEFGPSIEIGLTEFQGYFRS